MVAPCCFSQQQLSFLIPGKRQSLQQLSCTQVIRAQPGSHTLIPNRKVTTSQISRQLRQHSSRPSLCVHARNKDSYKNWIGAEESQDEPQEQQEFVDAPTSGSLEISKISDDVRDRVERAMETLNCRATVGDVAGAAGPPG